MDRGVLLDACAQGDLHGCRVHRALGGACTLTSSLGRGGPRPTRSEAPEQTGQTAPAPQVTRAVLRQVNPEGLSPRVCGLVSVY